MCGRLVDMTIGSGSFRTLVKIFLTTIILLIPGIIYPQTLTAESKLNIFSFDHFSIEDGLPNNHIQCVFQDSKGWIWLGTSHGLSRFDGYRFVNFINNPEDTCSLSGNLVRVIFEDNIGNLAHRYRERWSQYIQS